MKEKLKIDEFMKSLEDLDRMAFDSDGFVIKRKIDLSRSDDRAYVRVCIKSALRGGL